MGFEKAVGSRWYKANGKRANAPCLFHHSPIACPLDGGGADRANESMSDGELRVLIWGEQGSAELWAAAPYAAVRSWSPCQPPVALAIATVHIAIYITTLNHTSRGA
jgi:hypothetical protein